MEGKRKWGKDLLEFLKPYFDAGRTYEEIIIILSSEYDINFDLNEFKNLKFRYRQIYDPPEQKALRTSDPQGKYIPKQKELFVVDEVISQNKDFAQNKDEPKTELEEIFNDLIGDENIVEKQKREKEELFKTNTKGAKW